MPPVTGIRLTSPSEVLKVCRSSWAYYREEEGYELFGLGWVKGRGVGEGNASNTWDEARIQDESSMVHTQNERGNSHMQP